MQSLFTIQDIIPGEKAIPPLSPDLLAEAQSRLDSLHVAAWGASKKSPCAFTP